MQIRGPKSMSGRHRKRSQRRVEPYAWLGAGVATVAVGAAFVVGLAVAYADSADSAGGPSAGSSAAGTRRLVRPARASLPRDARAARRRPARRGAHQPGSNCPRPTRGDGAWECPDADALHRNRTRPAVIRPAPVARLPSIQYRRRRRSRLLRGARCRRRQARWSTPMSPNPFRFRRRPTSRLGSRGSRRADSRGGE